MYFILYYILPIYSTVKYLLKNMGKSVKIFLQIFFTGEIIYARKIKKIKP